ncbi:MAG: hypothetical protein ABWZ99_18365 [Ilumatobacteraceae bacterium]
MSDPNAFLFGGGGKAASFEAIGDAVEGRIENVVVSQQTSMEDNTPLTWPDGRPREQLVITLATDLREGDDDDGIRKLYAKGGKYEAAEGTGTSMKDAIADAVKKAGARSIDEGGTLKVGHTGIGKKTNRGYSAPKLYRATYTPPKASVGADELFDD